MSTQLGPNRGEVEVPGDPAAVRIDTTALATDLVVYALLSTLDGEKRKRFHAYVRRVIRVVEDKTSLNEDDRKKLVEKLGQWLAR